MNQDTLNSLKQLNKLIVKIEKKRNSKIVTLITSDRKEVGAFSSLSQDMADNVTEQLKYIKNTYNSKDFSKIDLLLYSRGGDSDAPWTIVRKIREYFSDKEFGVLIPHRAHSAATVISIGADEIVMGPNSEMGPIDATFHQGPYNPIHEILKTPLPLESESLTGYFSFIQDKLHSDSPEVKGKALDILKDKVHPLAIGGVYRVLQQTKYVAKKMLEFRKNKLDEALIDKITKTLSSEIYSHRHSITRSEARTLGIDFVKDAEDYKLVTEFDQFLTIIGKAMKFDIASQNSYNIEEHLNGNESYREDSVIISLIQSASLCKANIGNIEVERQYTPIQNININNVPLNVGINNLPAEFLQLNGQQLQEALIQWLNQNSNDIIRHAANLLLNEVKKIQPYQMHLKLTNRKWQEIDLN